MKYDPVRDADVFDCPSMEWADRVVARGLLHSRVLMKRLGFSMWLCTLAAGVNVMQFCEVVQ